MNSDEINYKRDKYKHKMMQTGGSHNAALYQTKLDQYNKLMEQMGGKDDVYVSPFHSTQAGGAPGMQVQTLSDSGGSKTYAIIFSKGDEAFSGLNDFAREYNVTAAHFKGIGALRRGTLGWFSAEKMMYKKIPIEEQVEVASIIGDIAMFEGKPVVHCHMVVGLPDGSAKAGHVIEAHVWPTLEIIITVEPTALLKSRDPATGLSLINPSLAKN
ncbi:MAG: DUF296 domain-containing protein [Hyperionvirus sp.]|uniref:DUF296 domain-containing protein n=1 Tax=Hyperionvirus sp. TaxID=2487770 RepID=A0A3G5AA89_9VIRU|nr:MAG: DUF296 domain-containing protein [Hyperionvirus sp.]